MLHRSGYIMNPHISWVISPWFFSSTYHGQIAQARPSVGGEQAAAAKNELFGNGFIEDLACFNHWILG